MSAVGKTMEPTRTYYCPECGKPLSGVPGTAVRCALCSRVVNLPEAGVGPAAVNPASANPAPLDAGPKRTFAGVVLLAAVVALVLLFMVHPAAVTRQWDDSATISPPAMVKSSLNPADRLRTIKVAIERYQERHGGALPDNLAVLIGEGDIESDVLADPRLGDTPAQGMTLDMMAAQLDARGHLSFVYLHPTNPHGVMVYERPLNGQTEIWALCADGRIEQISVAQANR
jgi:hypothetical protein